MNTLIIDARQCRSKAQRLQDMVLTAMLWGIYLYLSREALLFLAMVLDWLVNPEGAWLKHRFAAILPTLLFYAQVAAFNGLVLYAWAFSNQLRFRNRDRRRGVMRVGAADLARVHRVPEADVAQWLEARRLVIHHDAGGGINHIDIGFPQRPKLHAIA